MVKLSYFLYLFICRGYITVRATCAALCVAEGERGHSPHENWVVLVTVQCIENFTRNADLLLSPQ